MQFLNTAVLIFGLLSAACAIATPARPYKADNLETTDVKAGDLQAQYEAYDLERRKPTRTRPKRPNRPQRQKVCKKTDEWCASDSECCSKSCEKSLTNTCD
ncbi:uncharacterized protein LY79DRAFT_573794 [Colletotrichum navitas]|uniref:Uncharacterized protein n=1 Tax=Colletotrichum navitas TaxID=681940 RepID=A0AAD8PJ68_9PEZI|nr:uncharacterized protein LY79DRAFT_573794 [Colletotrichum navitas]KAK1564015.1 hypothetical protein LY79DRAFT_573794 [Colletotrichum navitas]